MKYAVIGAGGMGIQYGVLLQEFAHKDEIGRASCRERV